MNADGTDVIRVSEDVMDDAGPVWSPDGSLIAFFSGSFATREYGLYVMNADGSGRTRLADSNGHVGFFPAWSPDGTVLAFESVLPGLNRELLLVGRDGSGLVNITNHPSVDSWPTWAS